MISNLLLKCKNIYAKKIQHFAKKYVFNNKTQSMPYGIANILQKNKNTCQKGETDILMKITTIV